MRIYYGIYPVTDTPTDQRREVWEYLVSKDIKRLPYDTEALAQAALDTVDDPVIRNILEVCRREFPSKT